MMESLTSEIDKAVLMKNYDLVKPKGQSKISHQLPFTYDILLFGKVNKKTLTALEKILINLSSSAGLHMIIEIREVQNICNL